MLGGTTVEPSVSSLDTELFDGQILLLHGPTGSLDLTADELMLGLLLSNCYIGLLKALGRAHWHISASKLVADHGHWQHSQCCSSQKSLALLILLNKPALDHSEVVQHHVLVNANGGEGQVGISSQPKYEWVVYMGTLFNAVSFIMFGNYKLT